MNYMSCREQNSNYAHTQQTSYLINKMIEVCYLNCSSFFVSPFIYITLNYSKKSFRFTYTQTFKCHNFNSVDAKLHKCCLLLLLYPTIRYYLYLTFALLGIWILQ